MSDSKRSALYEKFKQNLDQYRDGTTWINFVENFFENDVGEELFSKFGSLQRKIFDVLCEKETELLLDFAKQLSEDELHIWIHASEDKVLEVSEEIKKLNSQ